MTTTFDSLPTGYAIEGKAFPVSRESIRLFCEGSLDFNPLHLDDNYMEGSFGKTAFNGVIMHGMNNFGIMTRMLTDWAYALEATHRRLETRWLKPVYPGDVITPSAKLKNKTTSAQANWAVFEVVVTNQKGDLIATGEALIEFPKN